MGRGKIEIKRIENPINRQVTYSKRRNGIFKKAQELTVLCDAKVSIIMFSNTSKLHEYISPNISMKKIYDQYQKRLLDRSMEHALREDARALEETEGSKQQAKERDQRMGEELNDLSVHELRGLEQKMSASLTIIRDRKGKELGGKARKSPTGLLENQGDYDSAVAFANGVSNLYDFRLQPNHPNLHHGGGFGSHDLRLA
ncbi:K-box region and MADS-box transcription factor family protein [Actinidia rufa]|uniref:K-box region and MADS-box transcription factor family protein n=1 Tax=Actinidia rufa TaxID=165716 RepID=A0A7J0E1N3_9ERIC|nr:K-box region and MADS-box transcription factor family protein [Actinidia rufa]